MTFRTCSYEEEVRQALKDGHWPNGCAPELRAHVQACGTCSDFVLVTQAFQRAREQSTSETLPDSSSLLWWRAQLRRRNDAEHSISKPITVAQIFAWAVTLIVFGVFVATQYRQGLHWGSWWPGVASSYLSRVFQPTPKMDWNILVLISSLGLLAVLSGVVLYLVSEEQ